MEVNSMWWLNGTNAGKNTHFDAGLALREVSDQRLHSFRAETQIAVTANSQ